MFCRPRLFALAALPAALLLFAPAAEARPQYFKAFNEAYPAVSEAANKARCFTCHGADKTENNAYGTAFKEALAAENVKDPAALAAAFKAAADRPSSTDGQTFGDLLNAGKLPQ